VFKNRGSAGADIHKAGVRLGNVLFVIAAAIALAASHDMALRLSVSEAWKEYFTDPTGIFTQLPTSLWYHRNTHADVLLGSPAYMQYQPLEVPPNARTVMLHGYFQNAHYFAHQLPLIRSLLTPHACAEAARDIWKRTASSNMVHLAIHIRLGDKQSMGLSVQYYRRAVVRAKPLLPQGQLLCVFFSDNPGTIRGELGSRICKQFVVFDEPVRDDMALMVMATCCAGIVISASTFSWWAAVLGQYQVVVAPLTDQPRCHSEAANFTLSKFPGWLRLPVPCE